MSARAPLALPVGPVGREMASWLPIAGGTWRRFEASLGEELCQWLAELGEGVTQWPDAPDELLVLDVDDPGSRSWARVRLTVEVLDGVL